MASKQIWQCIICIFDDKKKILHDQFLNEQKSHDTPKKTENTKLITIRNWCHHMGLHVGNLRSRRPILSAQIRVGWILVLCPKDYDL